MIRMMTYLGLNLVCNFTSFLSSPTQFDSTIPFRRKVSNSQQNLHLENDQLFIEIISNKKCEADFVQTSHKPSTKQSEHLVQIDPILDLLLEP